MLIVPSVLRYPSLSLSFQQIPCRIHLLIPASESGNHMPGASGLKHRANFVPYLGSPGRFL